MTDRTTMAGVRPRRLPATLALVALLAAMAMFTVAALGARSAGGADHGDAPLAAADRAADIADLYAFRSPEQPDHLVVALTVNPLTTPAENGSSNFAPGVNYHVHVDGDGDLVADATVTARFSGDPLQFTISGLGSPISGLVTPPAATPVEPMVTEAGGIRVFAGQRDDPFFFDLVGFSNFVAAPEVPAMGLRPAGETPADTLAGTNVSALVLELPITALTGASTSDTGVIRAWATTDRAGQRVDRMAIPAINTALIPSDLKDAFNQANPVDDATLFRSDAEATVAALRGALEPLFGPEDGGPLGDLDAATVASALIPDVVTIDFSAPVAFPNGRQLADDVVDAALGIVLNRGGAAGVGDAIDGNDVPFGAAFPYLAAPHAGSEVVPAPADTGNAGIAERNTDLGVALPLAGGVLFALLAALLAARAALAPRRG